MRIQKISLHFCIHGIRATLTRTVNYFLTDSPLKLSAFVCSNVSTRIVEDYSSSLHRYYYFFFLTNQLAVSIMSRVSEDEVSGDSSKQTNTQNSQVPPSGSVDNLSLQITTHRLNGQNVLRWPQLVKLFIKGKGENWLFDWHNEGSKRG